MGAGLHVAVAWTRATYLNIVAGRVHPSWQRYSLMTVASSSRIRRPVKLQKMFSNDLRVEGVGLSISIKSMTINLKLKSVYLSIYL